MNLDAFIWMILSILCAASIAGGLVMYIKSTNPYARAFGAASAAAGIVMLGIVMVTLPLSHTQNKTPEPTIHYQEYSSGEWQQHEK